jgi:hypothetical protein
VVDTLLGPEGTGRSQGVKHNTGGFPSGGLVGVGGRDVVFGGSLLLLWGGGLLRVALIPRTAPLSAHGWTVMVWVCVAVKGVGVGVGWVRS